MSIAAIVLAAGKGTRMTADLPKVLHRVGERPMISYVVDAIRPLADDEIFVVIGYKAEEVRKACASSGVHFVVQNEQLGTGHAVAQCEGDLKGFAGTVVVLNGDVPGLRETTIRRFVDFHTERRAAATVLTADLDDPTGYGRIVKDSKGALLGIIEEKDADGKTRAIREINSGLFCFEKDKLFGALKSVDRNNAQGEYYLTDVIATLRERGERVFAYRVDDAREVAGVNTDGELESIRDYMQGEGR
jgi:UDP-N-acetylglucosamine diphosphorylase/glucosamine-1-phosphate N-acetyltransferase